MTRFPIDLATRVLACLADDDFQAAPSSMLEPTDFVTDVDRWERERRQFFEYGPQIVAWGGELAGPGSFITREVCGVPVLITRVADGSLRAFRNACTHRGTEVATYLHNGGHHYPSETAPELIVKFFQTHPAPH